MMLVSVVFVLVLVCATCVWSGRMLSRHYQDGLEVMAVVAIGASVLLALRVMHGLADDEANLAIVAMVLAAGSGLVWGYITTNDRDRVR